MDSTKMGQLQPGLSQPDQSLLGLSNQEIKNILQDWGEKPFRAAQIIEWLYQRRVTSFDEMTNISKSLRTRLAESFRIYESRLLHDSRSSDGTRKLLLGWDDNETSECVMIPDDDRRTACISTQVGCPVGCTFCASGMDGLKRNLSTAQIVEQAMRISNMCDEQGDRLSNVVVMGVGEPLANYDATIAAVRIINAEWGMNIGARKITVSTVGLTRQIRQLADEDLQITLALSLHAPNDELRAKLIPWAGRVEIQEIIDAGRFYFDKTGREITIEYVLLNGVNDSLDHADGLVRISRKMRSNVNLIAYNSVSKAPFQRTANDRAKAFLDRLRSRGVNAHLRRSRGMDIEGACGQLRRRWRTMDSQQRG